MPNNLRILYQHIVGICNEQSLSPALRHYAVGWIFFDVFERADHDTKNGIDVKSSDFDRYARDIPESKIERDIFEAQQDFGRAAADFMEDEIQRRIQEGMDNSIVTTVKANTSGAKVFWLNVSAGVVAGIIFALITVGGYFLVRIDPSINAVAKAAAQTELRPATNPPAAPRPFPAPPK